MANNPKDGGPAFPRPYGTDEHSSPCNANQDQQGMSLRQWYAGMVLPGIVHAGMTDIDAAKAVLKTGLGVEDSFAIAAFAISDALIAQGDKK